jgi:hypothetical protein
MKPNLVPAGVVNRTFLNEREFEKLFYMLLILNAVKDNEEKQVHEC